MASFSAETKQILSKMNSQWPDSEGMGAGEGIFRQVYSEQEQHKAQWLEISSPLNPTARVLG